MCLALALTLDLDPACLAPQWRGGGAARLVIGETGTDGEGRAGCRLDAGRRKGPRLRYTWEKVAATHTPPPGAPPHHPPSPPTHSIISSGFSMMRLSSRM